jgi:hypothetical protein
VCETLMSSDAFVSLWLKESKQTCSRERLLTWGRSPKKETVQTRAGYHSNCGSLAGGPGQLGFRPPGLFSLQSPPSRSVMVTLISLILTAPSLRHPIYSAPSSLTNHEGLNPALSLLLVVLRFEFRAGMLQLEPCLQSFSVIFFR